MHCFGLGFRVQGSRISGFWFRGALLPFSGSKLQEGDVQIGWFFGGSRPGAVAAEDVGLRVSGSGFAVQGSGFRVQGSGFRVYGSVFRA